MNGLWRWTAIGFSVLAGAPGLLASDQSGPRPQLTVMMCDRSGVADEVRRHALEETARIFGAAGVEFRWIETSTTIGPADFKTTSLETCASPPEPVDFWVVIAGESPDNWPGGALGVAVRQAVHCPRAYILYDRVRRVAHKHGFGQGRPKYLGSLLGAVIAHELGHLLMPEAGHSATGLMSPEWGFRESSLATQSGLGFHPAQARRIQKALGESE